MASMSKMTLIGNVGADAEMKYLPGGQAVTSFSVAVNERRRQPDGETAESTQWYRVSCWSRLAEIAGDFVRKGRSVYVEGPVQVREFVGADGQKRVSLDVTARELQLLDSRGGEAAGPVEDSVVVPNGQEQRGGAARRSEVDDARVRDVLPF